MSSYKQAFMRLLYENAVSLLMTKRNTGLVLRNQQLFSSHRPLPWITHTQTMYMESPYILI